MERETKMIVTPVGKKSIEIKTYITGKEKRELTNVYLSGDIKFNAESQNIGGINAAIVDKAQDLALKLIVVSIDGNAENIVETILNMRAEDYDFIVKSVDELQKGFSEEKKTI